MFARHTLPSKNYRSPRGDVGGLWLSATMTTDSDYVYFDRSTSTFSSDAVARATAARSFLLTRPFALPHASASASLPMMTSV